jgi:triphosphoribosyl-dephospho-CoA synthase
MVDPSRVMPDSSRVRRDPIAHAKACFLRACELDVAVRKPGNVSRASAGHGMQAEMFVASANAAADPLFERAARVGDRIEAAVNATFGAVGCNTNLGILLLCAPIACAVERAPDATTPRTLRAAIEAVLADLNLADSQAAYRAIARAHPGGLGTAANEDVRDPAGVGLRAAMSLASHRDSIARQYRDGYADLFDIALPALFAHHSSGFSLMSANDLGDIRPALGATERTADPAINPAPDSAADSAPINASIQRLYLTLLSRYADSHIVRIHGEAVAHSVMAAAQGWLAAANRAQDLDGDADFITWDATLKAHRINPGTTADLTVAALVIAGLVADAQAGPNPGPIHAT